MSALSTTKLSSKGQVVIPEEVRNRLHLKEGTQFVVIGEGDAVVLKAIAAPKMSDFESLLDQAQRSAKKAGLKKSDIDEAIASVRADRRKKRP